MERLWEANLTIFNFEGRRCKGITGLSYSQFRNNNDIAGASFRNRNLLLTDEGIHFTPFFFYALVHIEEFIPFF